MPRRSRSQPDPLATFPEWARRLAERYYTKTVSTFILHGAVRDLQPADDGKGGRRFVALRTFLSDELFGSRDLVVFYDRSSGIRLATPEMQKDFMAAVAGYDSLFGTEYAKAVPKDPTRAFPLLESYARVRIADGKSVAFVIDFAETVAPAGDLGFMPGEDRYALVTLVKWAQDPQFLSADFSVCLVAENLAELNPRIGRNPYASQIEIPLPSEKERAEYIEWKLSGRSIREVSDVNALAMAQMTAGMSRVSLDRILTEALSGAKLTADRLKEKKKEIIQAECLGLLEFIEPQHSIDMVAGHAKAKQLLRQAARAIQTGKRDVVPMGFLIAGPIGTGKTFLSTCFAGEIGIPCVKFLNFRSQWQGVTEGNLERIFNLLKAMWPVAVIVDEADAFLGNRSAQGDSGTSARVFSQIATFMGNTDYRGKIVWFLLTSRPDLLPVDLKRQGRAEEHLALFYPESHDERLDLARTMAKKAKVQFDGDLAQVLPPDLPKMSGADIEAALVRAKLRAVSDKREKVTQEDLKETFADFVPPNYPLEVELQTLVAVAECTSRELLPESYRQKPRDEITRRIRELKLLLLEQ
ncbi:MAG TPA: AAA family ATPase [Myxococcales bacterium]|jgi:SpoVK/Ycf46/Vps4 family AAA+-type ATPase|nr:AAA family ATPase [Myxococcales bacterium]